MWLITLVLINSICAPSASTCVLKMNYWARKSLGHDFDCCPVASWLIMLRAHTIICPRNYKIFIYPNIHILWWWNAKHPDTQDIYIRPCVLLCPTTDEPCSSIHVWLQTSKHVLQQHENRPANPCYNHANRLVICDSLHAVLSYVSSIILSVYTSNLILARPAVTYTTADHKGDESVATPFGVAGTSW